MKLVCVQMVTGQIPACRPIFLTLQNVPSPLAGNMHIHHISVSVTAITFCRVQLTIVTCLVHFQTLTLTSRYTKFRLIRTSVNEKLQLTKSPLPNGELRPRTFLPDPFQFTVAVILPFSTLTSNNIKPCMCMP